jgi:hypothetical protein
MTQQVIHRPRVAWDGARAFVDVIEAGKYRWLSEQLGARISREAQDHALACVVRLSGRPGTEAVEAGMWRAFLDDVLGSRPDLAGPLLDIIAEAKALTGTPLPWPL